MRDSLQRITVRLTTYLLAAITLGGISLWTSCAAGIAQARVSGPPETAVAIGTHSIGSAYHAWGSGLAKVMSEHSPLNVSVQPFGGPNAWMPMMNRGELELGISSWPDADWAFRGVSGYREPMTNVRMLVSGHLSENIGLVVRKDSGITAIAQLAGKRVAYGFGGNIISHLLVEAALASVGLSWADVVRVPVPANAEALRLLRENRIDATFGVVATSANAVEVHTAIGLRALDYGDIPPDKLDAFPPDSLRAIQERIPGAIPALARAGLGYLDRDTTVVKYPVVVTAAASLSEEAAYHLVKALWEHYEELHAIQPSFREWTPETMFVADPPAPYHPGAVRFFKEVGVWTDEVERQQRALLEATSG